MLKAKLCMWDMSLGNYSAWHQITHGIKEWGPLLVYITLVYVLLCV